MNIPTVFVSSIYPSDQALAWRWETTWILNSQGILTDFNANPISYLQTDNQNMSTPLTLIIDESRHFKVKNNFTETEKALSSISNLIDYLHDYIRSCAP
jgi:hypothetical protein